MSLSTDAHTAMLTDSSYVASQRSLVTCLNGLRPVSGSTSTIGSFNSFEDVLSRYTGSTKRNMESGGACNTQGEAMFRTVQSVVETKLANLKSTRPEYAAFLATDSGQGFEQLVADTHAFKQNIVLLSGAKSSSSSGASGEESSSSTTGLACIPSNGREPSTLQKKLDVLNCLVFETPHRFWEDQMRNPTLRNLINRPAYKEWLGYEKWDCSNWLDSPLPSCLKHDVAWDSLRKFIGASDDTIDAAWNPRNKYLADTKFFIDIAVHGCQQQFNLLATIVQWCNSPKILQALTMLFGVRAVNDKSVAGWVYTHYDLDHIRSNFTFAEYNIPHTTSVAVQTVSSSLLHQTGYKVTWRYEPGTVSTAVVDQYRLSWEPVRGTTIQREVDVRDLTTESNGKLSYTLYILGRIQSLKSIEVSPTRKLSSPLLYGQYYPPYEVKIRY